MSTLSSARRAAARPNIWRATVAVVLALIAGPAITDSVDAHIPVDGDRFTEVAASGRALGEPTSFVPIRPVRVLDTRFGNSIGLTGPFESRAARTLRVTGNIPTHLGTRSVVPAGAAAVALNVTVVAASRAGFLTVRPADDVTSVGGPGTSNLNFDEGEVVPNAVITGLSGDGRLEIVYDAYGSSSGAADVLVDVTGYFVDTAVATAAGADGQDGEHGADGADGVDGQDGADGADGQDGEHGAVGPAGPAGPAGAPGIGAVGGPAVLSVRLLTDVIPVRQDGGDLAAVTKEDVGYYVVDMGRSVASCTTSASHVNYGTGLPIPVFVSVGLHADDSKLVVRLSDETGARTDGTSTDGVDVLAFCLNDAAE